MWSMAPSAGPCLSDSYIRSVRTSNGRGSDMAISQGDKVPDAELLRLGDGGPETVSLGSLPTDGKMVLFAVPGAFTGVCTTAHMPSFV
ncbi:MAG: redoxin family protein, partial [Pseudomonadota bacterium]